jgi:hypothetical protein
MYVFYKHALLHGLNISLVVTPSPYFSSSISFRLYARLPLLCPMTSTFLPLSPPLPPSPPPAIHLSTSSYWLLLNSSCVAASHPPSLHALLKLNRHTVQKHTSHVPRALSPAAQLRSRVFSANACEERSYATKADAAHAEGDECCCVILYCTRMCDCDERALASTCCVCIVCAGAGMGLAFRML